MFIVWQRKTSEHLPSVQNIQLSYQIDVKCRIEHGTDTVILRAQLGTDTFWSNAISWGSVKKLFEINILILPTLLYLMGVTCDIIVPFIIQVSITQFISKFILIIDGCYSH